VATARDGCVVETGPLAELLRGFVDSWGLTRPSTAGRFTAASRRTEVSPVGAVTWLAAETRRQDPAGRGIPEGTIQNIVRGRHRLTELRTADALVTALERPEVFHDGTLRIRPNPSAPAALRASCCGGVSEALAQIQAAYGPPAPQSLTGAA
jgi:hypothetical protein